MLARPCLRARKQMLTGQLNDLATQISSDFVIWEFAANHSIALQVIKEKPNSPPSGTAGNGRNASSLNSEKENSCCRPGVPSPKLLAFIHTDKFSSGVRGGSKIVLSFGLKQEELKSTWKVKLAPKQKSSSPIFSIQPHPDLDDVAPAGFPHWSTPPPT